MRRTSILPEAQIIRSLTSIHLHDLQKAFHLLGWYTRYDPGGVGPPRLYAWHPLYGELQEAICAVHRCVASPKPSWWFQWASGDLICRARNVYDVVSRIESFAKNRTLSARLARDAVELSRAPGGCGIQGSGLASRVRRRASAVYASFPTPPVNEVEHCSGAGPAANDKPTVMQGETRERERQRQ
jgi:hypothetical protein